MFTNEENGILQALEREVSTNARQALLKKLWNLQGTGLDCDQQERGRVGSGRDPAAMRRPMEQGKSTR